MAGKPLKIKDNVSSWMLPKSMRDKFPTSSQKTAFSSVLKSGRDSGGSRSTRARQGGTTYNPRSAGHRSITMDHAKRLARYAPVINHCARKYRIPVSLICGIMLQESGGNPNAVSHCGARGLMQLMPGTAKRFGVTSIMDPRQNIEGGVRYLSFLKDKFHGNIPLMVAAYNAGEGNVAKYGNKIPPFTETQNYVPSVIGFARTIQDLLVGGIRIDKPEAVSNQSPLPRFMKLA
ncbi:MAG: transglycosylase [Deltaproteobacteria bacterium CG11_big_fil_rev_8_21_14_0_20_47_16]|nr:MAG: transglycosylase [Deltaproteobacteria bacterium CG11_big_fil_rev_8_21_14_0_20_47_16]